MALVEPIHGAPAAIAHVPDGPALVIADYHAGIEAALRQEGIELEDRATTRRDRLLNLISETDADRLIVLGDLAHFVGAPRGDERAELEALCEALEVPLTLVTGNHDAEVAETLDIETRDSGGFRLGSVGFVHGHSWPEPSVLSADVVCTGHEHVRVRLADEVGPNRSERAWLRGQMDESAVADRSAYESISITGEMIVFPAFNDRSGGTAVNEDADAFLSPFLPALLPHADVFLLDGTNLGDYRSLPSGRRA